MLRNPSLSVLAACRLIKTTPLFTRGGNRGRCKRGVPYSRPPRSTDRYWTDRVYRSISISGITLEREEAFNRGYPLIRTFVRARFVVIS